ncbi:melanoma-associated antigen E1 [Eulemur rufifrons]|uniref:melanoma-associated antigen E1 n=1 Tax=Eulemur rufifrons TaxID=859984 RepID=UPI003742F88C
MSLVSQNSRRRRRRGATATAHNSSSWGEIQAPNASGFPTAMPDPDVPQDHNDPQILHGLCASEGPSASVLPTPGEAPSTSGPPTISEGSSAYRQPTISEGQSTSVLSTPGEGPSTSGPPTISKGPNTSVLLTASEGQSASGPPTSSEKLSTSMPPNTGEGPSTTVQPTAFEGASTSMPPTPGEGPTTSVLPTASEGSGISVLPALGEGPSISVRPPLGEGPSTYVPPPLGEGRSTYVPPPLGEGPSTSAPPSASERSGISVPSPLGEGPSTSVPPTASEGPGTYVPPPLGEGPSTYVPPTASEGPGTSVQPPLGEGPSTFVLPPLGEGPSTSVPPTASEGPGTSVPPPLGEGPSTSVPPTASEGSSTSMPPAPGEGLSTLLRSSASVNPKPSKCSNVLPNPTVAKASTDSDSRSLRGAEGPLEFQVQRDCESTNSITIMGLSTSRVAITPKPQDPMEQNVAELLQFLLVKDQSKYPIRESEMREYIVKEYRSQFPEILRRAAAHLECIFRFELRELDPEARTYILLNKLGPVPFEGLEESPNGPKMGLLMMILGQIFLNGNQAKEAEIWEMLWRMGVQRERRLSIFGNPKRLLSVEFVWQRYLDYRPITDRNPVEYEFFWGPRSHLETTKMKILKFMARIYNKDPMDWPEQYNEALEEDAARALAEGWQALPHFRRPFFEEADAEAASPDSEVSNHSSKYPPHSWPESRLESKARKLVQLFLLMDSTKLPIPKKGILYYIGRECSKVFPDLLNRAARTLNHVYGTELVVLDPRNHSYTLYNRREMEDTEEIVDSPNRPGNNFLMQVLSFIFITGNHARESAVWAFLRGLGVQSGRKHVITCRYLSQRYIDSLRVPDTNPVQYEFVWGPRARLETSKMKALRYVARIHRRNPQDWPQQYREAMEDEANRADVGHRQFFAHNF